jgi:hypothetical protein
MERFREAWIHFYEHVEEETGFGTAHASLFMALLYTGLREGNENFRLHRNKVMALSLIKSRHTYGKCLRELHDSGYIIYSPSCSKKGGSRVQIKMYKDRMPLNMENSATYIISKGTLDK